MTISKEKWMPLYCCTVIEVGGIEDVQRLMWTDNDGDSLDRCIRQRPGTSWSPYCTSNLLITKVKMVIAMMMAVCLVGSLDHWRNHKLRLRTQILILIDE